MYLKVGPVGGEKGDAFDDGVSLGVKKVTLRADEYSVTYIKTEYKSMSGKFETIEHGKDIGELTEFSVNPDDYIIAVGGSYNHIYTYDTTLITSLYFVTSKGITSPLSGKTSGTEFKLEDKFGGKLLGFFGRSGIAIDAIGAYFDTILRKQLKE